MAEGGDQVANGEPQMADGGCQLADDQCESKSGGCHDGESSDPRPEVSLGQAVRHDSHRVIETFTNDKIGILSHGGTDVADRPGQSDCVRQGTQ